jgi:hypothetical protein
MYVYIIKTAQNISRLLKLNTSGYTAVYSRPYVYNIKVLYVEVL